ncbi:IQ calmodulin-binding motif protein [Talaromyces stipitatus ATCC 10500]|uniref:IQ calmodulin-binding motif protein n=1 Tax=Talaromyces stipitatus (strain ATCC 10500 / CBS 375.48 / QM 6759 / NRRL 1006) TaxID=441959 RepID=B8MF90_TALSN|nr:IQ calmodulin-binding motif protein [Talaromyces stipitatus ATCC 10500]EED16189.1 IQ calmodulin-binding motif protein [Talaromyces stipitatus ATCC 10500]
MAASSDPEMEHDVTASMNQKEERAARTIQRYYRGYRTRRELKGWSLSSSTRWLEAVQEAQWHQAMRNQYVETSCDGEDRDDIIHNDDEGEEEEEGEEEGRKTSRGLSPEVRRKWKLAGQVALRAGGDDNLQDKVVEENVSEEKGQTVHTFQESISTMKKENREPLIPTSTAAEVEKKAKMMDLQYFLEMVDTKHRYGSNLRAYHSIWKNSPSKQNFFYWLDYGEGKDVEVERVPRERLEREQVRYLSREERQDYLVVVDEAGRFRWAKNGERVWTDSDQFRDSIRGVVPVGDKTPTFQEYTKEGDEVITSEDDDDEDEDDSDEESDEEIQRYVNPDFDNAKGIKKIEYVSPAVVFNHLMQKSLKKRDKWIFVHTSFRIYIGIKESGAFQHSSFLRGARISAAGLIKIKDGQLRSLSPLSGHYRPPAANFRAFVHALQDNGVDMSRVSISRSYAVLVGIEGYMKFKQKKKDVKDMIEEEKSKVSSKKEKEEGEEVPDVSRSRPTRKKSKTTTTTVAATEEENEKGGFFSTIARTITRRGTTQESKTVTISGRGVPGTAPEEGVPAPEGKR